MSRLPAILEFAVPSEPRWLRFVAEHIVRILSDLHYLDRGGLEALSELTPLMEGVRHLILNGDTVETRHPKCAPYVTDVLSFFKAAPLETTFITGNHDPGLSPTLELSLAGGAVWVTHGDIFWDCSAPWSRFAPLMRRLIREERERMKLDEQQSALSDLLVAHRSAHIRSGTHYDPTRRELLTRLYRLASILFPPRQPYQMWRAWRHGAQLARQWAQRHRPEARFVLFGHMHYPGVWLPRDSASGPIVINTGSFERPFGAFCVDLLPDRVQVRRIEKRGRQRHVGRVLHDFPLAPSA